MSHPARPTRAAASRSSVRRILAAGTVALFAGAAAAQDCADAATQADANQCAVDAYQAADRELNAAWRAAKAAIGDGEDGARLLDSQRKWLAYRDAACAVERAQFAGGSMVPMVEADCLERLTSRRAEDLRGLVN